MFPEFDPQRINIQVTYPGASPEEIEETIVKKIEQNLKGTSGIDRTTSVSSKNQASITVEVLESSNTDVVLQDVKNAVNRINSFPADMEPPVIFKQQSRNPVISFALYNPLTPFNKGDGNTDLYHLKKIAKNIEDDFRAIEGISQIGLSGFPDEEISINIREHDLRSYQLTFEEVAIAVRQANIDISAGSVKTDEEEILIRLQEKKYYAKDLENIALKASPDGKIVYLKDVATVADQWAESPVRTFIDGKPAVVITVTKTTEEDILFIAEHVKNYVQNFNNPLTPFNKGDDTHSNIKAEILNDFTVPLKQRIELMIKNGLLGVLLVLLCLALFMNLHLSWWVAIGIPFCFAGMFIIANYIGITINVISTFGMIVVLGILIDGGIIVGENIYQHHEQGKPALKAAIDGTMQVMPSVFSGILTNIVAFLPFFFIAGVMGKFIWNLAFVVIAVFIFALIKDFLILPAHLAHSKSLYKKENTSKSRQFMDKAMFFLREKLYAPALKFAIHNKALTLAIPIAMVLLTLGAIKGEIIGITFFPFIDQDRLDINISLTPGTRQNVTEGILNKIEKAVWEVNEEFKAIREDKKDIIVAVKKDIGAESASGFQGPIQTTKLNNSHIGGLSVILLNGEERNIESFKISNAIREKVGPIKEAEKLTYGKGGRFGKPVSISLLGKNLEELHKVKEALKEELQKLSALKEVTDNDQQGLREINIRLKQKAINLGFSKMEIIQHIRQGFFGLEIQRLLRGNDEVRVWVRYAPKDRSSINKLENMRIRTPNNPLTPFFKGDGNEYPLSELVDYSIERGIVAINHIDGMRAIRVEADLVNKNEPLTPIMANITDNILPEVLAAAPGVKRIFEGQKREQMKLQNSIKLVLPLALVLILIIMILNFRSVVQAVIVFTLIPLGLIGVSWGHFFHGLPLNFFSAFGIIALSGIIVNDAIVFIDTMNRLIKDGKPLADAVYEAGISRFRPILLTSLTTICGLTPLLLEKSMQAQFLIPMAIAVAYGLLFATMINLIVLPSVLMLVNKIKIYLIWLWEGQKPSSQSVEPAYRELMREGNIEQ